MEILNCFYDYTNMSNIYFTFYRFIAISRMPCKGSVGLPLAVQIVGRRYNEELVLRLMKELERIVNFDRM